MNATRKAQPVALALLVSAASLALPALESVHPLLAWLVAVPALLLAARAILQLVLRGF